MTSKRVVIVFVFFAILVCVLNFRLFMIVSDERFANAAEAQSTQTVTAALKRPDFYDRYGNKLTGAKQCYMAVGIPGSPSGYNIVKYAGDIDLDSFSVLMGGRSPFLIKVSENMPSYTLVDCIEYQDRSAAVECPHLLGYLDSEGRGAAGLEYVFEDYLKEHSEEIKISYSVDATGAALPGRGVEINDTGAIGVGIQLTLDPDVQRAANEAADTFLRKGAVVVVDCATGEIAAMVSRPTFVSGSVGEALSSDDGVLVNRALAQYSVGSVFKMTVEAAALEAGISKEWEYTCTGSITVAGVTYSCAGGAAHGTLDMEGALAESCNCYHIALAQKIGAEAVRTMAARLGFGASIELARGYATAKGYLPSESELADATEFSNFSFGQGRLLASPLQIASYVSIFASGGIKTTPVLIKNTGDISSFSSESTSGESTRVISESTANIIAANMAAVMSYGTGAVLKPDNVSAAGKTGTAESGVFTKYGETIVSTFAGYFPANNPRYACVVVSERERDSDKVALRTFKMLCDLLYPAFD